MPIKKLFSICILNIIIYLKAIYEAYVIGNWDFVLYLFLNLSYLYYRDFNTFINI